MSALHLGSAAAPSSPCVVAIGNFDGLHLGHRAVIARLAELGAAHGAATCAYTFDPAPTSVVAPQRHQPRIVTVAERVRRLGEAGVDRIVLEPFTRAWAAHPARWFAEEVLGRRLRARAVVVGWDFRFGAGREGDVDGLRAWLPGVEVAALAPVEAEGAVVSSSRVRRLVQAGDVEAAAALLGRPHALTGTVIAGDRRGRTIGFPTANLENEVELVPANGVYATLATVDRGAPRAAVTNVGTRPTVDGTRLSIETHVLDFDGDLYGRDLRVELVARLREERRFPGLDALVAQIGADVAAAREILR